MLKTKTGFKTERIQKYHTNETDSVEGNSANIDQFLNSSPSKETPLHTPIKIEIPLKTQKTNQEESIYQRALNNIK